MKQHPILFTTILSISIALIGSCSSSDDVTEVVSDEAVSNAQLTEYAFSIDTAYIVGDTLVATVIYSGGCVTHDFELESAGFMMKSLPPKQPLRIIHRSDDDPCRAMIQEEIKFNLLDFRGTSVGVTYILLENWNQQINYSY